MIVGLIGGLVGTIVMDLFGAALFLMMGGSASLSFAIIGDAAAGGFALLGIRLVFGAKPSGTSKADVTRPSEWRLCEQLFSR